MGWGYRIQLRCAVSEVTLSFAWVCMAPAIHCGSPPSYLGHVVLHDHCEGLSTTKEYMQGIAMLNLGSTQVGMILLWGLFFYDIFWVFFTPVMVTVAKNIDGPIKLLFPTTSSWEHFNMLGLGDIVIPGMLLARSTRIFPCFSLYAFDHQVQTCFVKMHVFVQGFLFR